MSQEEVIFIVILIVILGILSYYMLISKDDSTSLEIDNALALSKGNILGEGVWICKRTF